VQRRRRAVAAWPIPGEQPGRPWRLDEVYRRQERLGGVAGTQLFCGGTAPGRRVIKRAAGSLRVSREHKVNTIDDIVRVAQME
jgi:hypothetical protein